ncbi:hypothetical protein [Aeromonas caviae]|uniref:hypothetical protein n=1 Tax=Aeromonas caviae TaxID=648 RepID=UPI0029D6A684|nr:hypothetical protein [Aeromonas caviae]MDX7853082.1 hypothetical protein [Aeromonas caviae]
MNNTHSHTPYAKPERSNIITYILGPDLILLGTGLKSFWRRDAERRNSSKLPYVAYDRLNLILRQARKMDFTDGFFKKNINIRNHMNMAAKLK